jgi:hypothetical protein
VLSALLRFLDSDYPFVIFKLFLEAGIRLLFDMTWFTKQTKIKVMQAETDLFTFCRFLYWKPSFFIVPIDIIFLPLTLWK